MMKFPTSFFLSAVICFASPIFAEEVVSPVSGQNTSTPGEQASEADMAFILERMQTLSGGLDNMPQPPKVDKKIRIPGVNLASNKDKENE